MSTFIKVTQEGSQLLRRNTEQTQGRRLAKLEADEQRRTEQQAREARQKALQQQGLSPSGDAFSDARRRRFRLDEPAAARFGSRVLIVTWSGIQPILSDRAAIRLYLEFSPTSVATTITAGGTTAALGVSGASNHSYWIYETRQSSVKGTSDFTYEAWVQLVSSARSMANIRLSNKDSSGAENFAMEMRYLYTDGSFEPGPSLARGYYFTIGDPIDGLYLNPFSFGTATPSPDAHHICMMRKNGLFYWFINGYLATVNPTEEARALSLTGNSKIDFGIYALGNSSPNKLGQLRLDPDRARYSINGFTPDPLPFRP